MAKWLRAWVVVLGALHAGIAGAQQPVTIAASAELSAYADSDHVSVITPNISLSARDADAGWSVGARYLVDVVSAASVDIVASASPRWSEVRQQVSANAGFTQGAASVSASASTSTEPDYFALSAGMFGGLALAEQRVTLAFGYVLGHDLAGRAGTPFSVFEHALWKQGPSLGASFVLDASSLLFVGIDAGFERGDQAKPYRYVPVFDASTAASLPSGASIDQVNRARRPESPLERLPLGRGRYALTLRYMRRANRATLRAEQRIYVDSWGQLASSSDLRWAAELARHLELAASARLHAQTGAAFWQRAYAAGSGAELPAIRTGDRELGPLWTVTLGLELRWSFAGDSTALRLRVAGMRTGYLDALYIDQRVALFTALGFEGSYE